MSTLAFCYRKTGRLLYSRIKRFIDGQANMLAKYQDCKIKST